MAKSKWVSVVYWPKPQVSLGTVENYSLDTHSTKAAAEDVVRILKRDGFGRAGVIFPLKCEVMTEEDFNFRSLLKLNTNISENEGWVVSFEDEPPTLKSSKADSSIEDDMAVWEMVSTKAEQGEELHQQVMLFLQRNNEELFSAITEITGY